MLPSLVDYLEGLTGPIIAAMCVGALLSITTIAIFFANLGSVLRNVPKEFKSKTVYLLSIYQIVSISQFILIVIPRSVAMVETVCIMSFGFGALVFHSLLLQYVKGETNLVKNSDQDAFKLRVPPFCLLPFTRPSPVTKNKLLTVRIMILQFPIIHGLIYIFYNMRMIEEPDMSTIYFVPFMFLSIIPVIWGLNILIRLVEPLVPDYNIKGKYFMVQLVLLTCKIQMIIGDLIYNNSENVRNLEIEPPMTVQHYKNVIIAIIILIQMVLLSLGAQKFYKTPKRSEEPDIPSNAETNIAVIS